MISSRRRRLSTDLVVDSVTSRFNTPPGPRSRTPRFSLHRSLPLAEDPSRTSSALDKRDSPNHPRIEDPEEMRSVSCLLDGAATIQNPDCMNMTMTERVVLAQKAEVAQKSQTTLHLLESDMHLFRPHFGMNSTRWHGQRRQVHVPLPPLRN